MPNISYIKINNKILETKNNPCQRYKMIPMMELATTAIVIQSDFLMFPIISLTLEPRLSDLSSTGILPAMLWNLLINNSSIETCLSSLFLIGGT